METEQRQTIALCSILMWVGSWMELGIQRTFASVGKSRIQRSSPFLNAESYQKFKSSHQIYQIYYCTMRGICIGLRSALNNGGSYRYCLSPRQRIPYEVNAHSTEPYPQLFVYQSVVLAYSVSTYSGAITSEGNGNSISSGMKLLKRRTTYIKTYLHKDLHWQGNPIVSFVSIR